MLWNVREQLWFVVEQFYDPVNISVAFPCAFSKFKFLYDETFLQKNISTEKKPTAINNVRALTHSAI